MSDYNLITLAMQLTSLSACISFLQDRQILPKELMCPVCPDTLMTRDVLVGNSLSKQCLVCKTKRSIRFNTILYKANISLRQFVLLSYILVHLSNLTYEQGINHSLFYRVFHNYCLQQNLHAIIF